MVVVNNRGLANFQLILLLLPLKKLTDGINVQFMSINTRLKGRLRQLKTKSMWGCLSSFPKRSGRRFLHTNQLFKSDHYDN